MLSLLLLPHFFAHQEPRRFVSEGLANGTPDEGSTMSDAGMSNWFDLDLNTSVQSPPPGFGSPEFAKANAEAKAYFAVRDAEFGVGVLAPLVRDLSPLAIDLVRWRYAQLDGRQTGASLTEAFRRSDDR